MKKQSKLLVALALIIIVIILLSTNIPTTTVKTHDYQSQTWVDGDGAIPWLKFQFAVSGPTTRTGRVSIDISMVSNGKTDVYPYTYTMTARYPSGTFGNQIASGSDSGTSYYSPNEVIDTVGWLWPTFQDRPDLFYQNTVEVRLVVTSQGVTEVAHAIVPIIIYQTLTVSTSPSNCTVTVTGVGTKSSTGGFATFPNLISGSYPVIVSKAGYTTKTATATIAASDVTQTIVLDKLLVYYDLTVTTTPTYCDVTVNGLTKNSGSLGSAVFNTLNANTYYPIHVTKSGYTAADTSVTMDSTKSVSVNLTALPTFYDLTVKTTPTNCNVEVIGIGSKSSATNGAVFNSLNSGQYTVKVTKDGYYQGLQTIDLTSTQTITMSLNPITYSLTVDTIPDGCTVDVTGQTTQNSQTTGAVFNIPMGSYTVTTAKVGYITNTQVVTITGDKNITVTLTPVTYTLTVKTTPSNGIVSIPLFGDKDAGTNGAVYNGLTIGTYSITASKTGYYPTTQPVIVDADKTVTISLNQITYTLTVVTSPLSCTVTANSITKTSAPYATYDGLIPGTYTVMTAKNGYVTKTENVAVTKDTTYAVTLTPVLVTYNLKVITNPGGATVEVIGTGLSQNSSTSGAVFNSLPSGTYSLRISKTNYSAKAQSVVMNQDRTITVVLSPSTPQPPIPKTPGFEIVTLIAAIGVAIFLLRKKRK